MLQVTPALAESLETVAVKDCVPFSWSEAVVKLRLTLIAGSGVEFEPPPPHPVRTPEVVNPVNPIARIARVRFF
jgi:hypothetical protein